MRLSSRIRLDERKSCASQPAVQGRHVHDDAGASRRRPSLGRECRSGSLQAQQMHHAVVGQTFGALQWVPGLSVPARLAQGTYDALSHGWYAAFRQGCGALFSLAGQAEQWITAGIPGFPSNADARVSEAARGAESGADAARMSLHFEDGPLTLAAGPLARLKERVCVFIHGLACDEHSWHFDSGAWPATAFLEDGPLHYGALLRRDLGFSALYLRYDTRLGLEENGRQLSTLLSHVTDAAPAVRELVLIGHSLGGLLARNACEQAASEGRAWASLISTLICLGVPDDVTFETRSHVPGTPQARGPGGKFSARRDLPRPAQGCALRMVSGNLSDDPSGHMLGHLLGDGFVSAPRPGRGAASHGADVQFIELVGLGHMGLLNHPRVYELIHGWLCQPAASPRGRSPQVTR